MSKKFKLSKDSSLIENFLMHGVDIERRKLYFGTSIVAGSDDADEFGFGSVAVALRAIDLMVEISSDPIEIHMHSYGGDPYHMLGLKDKILESGVKFKFYGRGRISSAATWIMVTCDERYLSLDTTVMVHNGGTYLDGVSGKVPMTEATIAAEEDERLQDRLNELYAENSRMPKKFWDKLVKRDCYMTAQEAILLGLADAIIPHKKRATLRKKRSDALAAHPSDKSLKSLVHKLFKRVHMADDFTSLEVHVPKDQTEVLPVYDNSEEMMNKLNENKEST